MQEKTELIRLAIADDHPVIIDGLKTILEGVDEISLVAEVNNGLQLLEVLEQQQIDVVLMDINMPEMNGIETTKHIRQKFRKVKVLAFSQYDEKRFVKQIFKKGANGYLLKNSPSNEIILAIKQVHKGERFLSSELHWHKKNTTKKKQSDYFFPELTPRELEVLAQIYLEKNTHEIADFLKLSHHTVESHRSNLLIKVGARNSAGLIKWAIENDILD